jgi:glutaredoxin
MYTVYSKPDCPQCDAAKALLTFNGHPYREVILDVGQAKLDESTYISREDLLQQIPTARTMPQIYEGIKLVGGLIDLKRHLIT